MADQDIQIENICTIIKNSRVNFLIGAGASVCKLEGKISYPLMVDLLTTVKTDTKILAYYEYLKDNATDATNQFDMVKLLFDKYLFSESANIEYFLSILEGTELYISEASLLESLKNIRNTVRLLILKRIKHSDNNTVLEIYKNFYNGLRKLKELNSFENQSFSVFTTNYDMLNEMAMEYLGIHFYSGFDGIIKRRFNMANYNFEYVNSYNVNKSQYLINSNHINLYKLHGSISWKYIDDLYECNPYENEFIPEIVYPSVAKFENTNLIAYYSALMRAFSNQICQKDSTLIVTGTSLGDGHINKIIENALSIDTFTLIVFAYGSTEYIASLKQKYIDFPNVIVYDKPMNFEKIGAFLLQLRGGTDEC